MVKEYYNYEINVPDYGVHEVSMPDQGFKSDVADEFMLSWIGQLIQNKFILDEKIYKTAPEDPNYSAYAPEELKGYEEYIHVFKDVKNKEHADFLKQKISLNRGRRERLDASERVWGPVLTSMLADPITYLPIPLSRGVSFGMRFVKGGAIGAGLVGPTEAIRRVQDPTSSGTETAMVMGGTVLMSGLFAGALGPRVLRGNEMSETLIKKVSEDGILTKVADDNHKIAHERNGHQPLDDDGWNWKDTNSVTRNTKVVYVNSFRSLEEALTGDLGKTVKEIEKTLKIKYPRNKAKESFKDYNTRIALNAQAMAAKPNRSIAGTPRADFKFKDAGETVSDPYARYDIKADIIYFNEAKVLADYSENVQIKGGKGRGFSPKETFGNVNAFKKYVIEVALQKAVYLPYKAYAKGKKGMTPTIYENDIHDIVLDKLARRKQLGETDLNSYNWLAKTWVKFVTPFGRAIETIKDQETIELVLRGFGDSGMQHRGAMYGAEVPNSAMIAGLMKFKESASRIRSAVDVGYMAKNGLDINVTNNTTGINTEIQFEKLQNVARKIKGQDMEQNRNNFSKDVFKALGSSKVFDKSDVYTQQAAVKIRKLLTEMDELNQQLNLYESGDAYQIKIKEYEDFIRDTTDELPLIKNAEQKAAMNENIELVQAKLRTLKKSGKGESSGQFVPDKNYVPLYPIVSKIRKNSDEFKKQWYALLSSTTMHGQPKKSIDIEVNKIYERITKSGEYGEDASVLAMEGANVFKLGSANFIKRNVNVSYNDMMESPIMNFYEQNVEDVLIRYSLNVSKSQEMAITYGDPFGEMMQHRHYHRLLKKRGATKSGRADVRKVMQSIDDMMNRHYMTFNTNSPGSFSKQTVEALKDYTSLVTMGGSLTSNLTELARPIMVHGFEKTFPLYKAYLTQNMGLFRKMLKGVHLEMGEPIEIALGAIHKFIQDSGYHGKGDVTGLDVNTIPQILKKLQVPFYWLNGLTPWTIFWKNFTSTVSSHGIILDSYKLANKVNPITKRAVSEKEYGAVLARLAQYGIDTDTAKLITRMPIEKEGNLFLANSTQWDTIPGGKIAREKYKFALHNQIENTIITPNITDTPNLIAGAVTLTSDESKVFLSNPLVNKILGAEKTPYGYKVNASWASLPFQFMPWAFAATNKMLINGFQARSRGEQQIVGSMLAMFTLGGVVAWLKNPYGVSQMNPTELAIEAVDRSGLLGLAPDVNYMLETSTQGLFGEMYGARSAVGVMTGQDIGPRYGDQTFGDAVGEFVGPAPSMPIDMGRILTGSYDYSTSHDMLRRMLPFQNLIFMKHLLRPLYSKGIEEIIG